ncbi:MAG: hypothetical protein K0S28_1348 [Paucimonas sp.]|jgi:uncharacterized protein|nr:hypothetical protein [Paucimonas sp.]
MHNGSALLHRRRRLIVPKAFRFINAFAEISAAKGYNASTFLQIVRNTRKVLMKLHATSTQHYQTVTGYDGTAIEINAVRFDYSLVVLPEAAPSPWPVVSFEALTAADFESLAALRPDVVILGTGERQRFAHPRLMSSLTAQRIGVECMDNHAACRTYNILMGEGRKVALALIIESGA